MNAAHPLKADPCDRRHPWVAFILVVLVCWLWAMSGTQVRGQWQPPVDLSNDPGMFAGEPNYDFDSSGKVHLVFHNFLDAVGNVWYTNNVSGSWSTPVHLASTGGKPSGPFLVVTPDQTIHVFWGKNGMWTRSKPVSGGSWTPATRLDVTYQGGYAVGAVKDSSGGVFFSWLRLFDSNPTPRNALWGRYRSPAGVWGPEELIVQGNSDSDFPMGSWLTVRNDAIYVTYSLSDSSWWKVRSLGPSGTWGAPVHWPYGGGLRLAWSPLGGEMAAAYGYNTGGGANSSYFEVFVRFSRDNGATWSPELNVSAANGLDRSIEIAYDSAGNFHTVWQAFACDGCKPNLPYRGRISGTWWPKSWIVNNNARTGHFPNALQALGTTLWCTYADNIIDGYEDVYITHNPQGNIGGTGTFSGYVRDQFGVGIDYVFVSLAGGYTTLSTANGSYSLVLPAGSYGTLTATKSGFSTATQSGGVLGAGQTIIRDFVMTGMAPGSVTHLTLQTGRTSNTVRWTNPTSFNFSGVMLRVKTGGSPSSPTDGTLLLDQIGFAGQNRTFVHSGLQQGVMYHYRIWTYFADASRYYDSGLTIAGAPAGPGDLDHDGDVDASDFGWFQRCLSGQAVPQNDPDCAEARLDGDADVDGDDLVLFRSCFSGAGILSNVNCIP